MDKKTLVDDPNDLALSHICSPADLCSGVGDFAIYLHSILMPLVFVLPSYPFQISTDGGKLAWVSLG